MEVVKVSGVRKTYGKKNVVDGLDMTVNKGDIYGFIGRNGAGKSTTLKMISGLAKASSGDIKLFEKPVTDVVARKRIGVLIENPGIYPNMSAYENMMLNAKMIGVVNAKNKVIELLEFVGLEGVGKKKTKKFSMGMKQRLGIAMALLGNPDLLILDEPINGLDPEGIIEIRKMILKLNTEKNMTIIISSHILGELSKVCNRYGIIKDGSLIKEMTSEEFEELSKDYLKLIVDDSKKAVAILTEQLAITDFKVYPENEIHIWDSVDSAMINRKLVESGVGVTEVYRHEFDLESYFLNLMGGNEND